LEPSELNAATSGCWSAKRPPARVTQPFGTQIEPRLVSAQPPRRVV
jgi:hypothetical protein